MLMFVAQMPTFCAFLNQLSANFRSGPIKHWPLKSGGGDGGVTCFINPWPNVKGRLFSRDMRFFGHVLMIRWWLEPWDVSKNRGLQTCSKLAVWLGAIVFQTNQWPILPGKQSSKTSHLRRGGTLWNVFAQRTVKGAKQRVLPRKHIQKNTWTTLFQGIVFSDVPLFSNTAPRERMFWFTTFVYLFFITLYTFLFISNVREAGAGSFKNLNSESDRISVGNVAIDMNYAEVTTWLTSPKKNQTVGFNRQNSSKKSWP